MPQDPNKTLIYHITNVANLPTIVGDGGLYSDAAMTKRKPNVVIGYDHIKLRRLQNIPVPCCARRYVGEFVPFYFGPRSPMLYIVNKGGTGHPPGCQKDIVHLVSTVAAGIATGKAWAVSSGNAGAFHTTFAASLEAFDKLDWEAIRATQWQGKQHQKMAEFLLADFFPWSSLQGIGCQNSAVAAKVNAIIAENEHQPTVEVKPGWYY